MKMEIKCLILFSVIIFCSGFAMATLPTDNLVIHLEADSGVYTTLYGTTPAADGNSVGSWHDSAVRGGFQIGVQGNSSLRPKFVANAINGQPAIRFENGAYLVVTPNVTEDMLNTSTLSWFVVYRWDSQATPEGAGAMAVVAAASSGTPETSFGWAYLIYGDDKRGGAQIRDIDDQRATAFGAIPSDYFLIGSSFWMEFSGNALHYLNGENEVSSDLVTPAEIVFNGLGIGGNIYGSRSFTGEIATILVYDTVLSVSEQQDVEDYLFAKYNICNQPLQPVSGFVPSDGGIVDIAGTLSWDALEFVPSCEESQVAVTYEVILARDEDLDDVVESWTGISETSVTPSDVLDIETEYYWQVTADVNGQYTSGPVVSFSTILETPPFAPQVPVMDGLVLHLDSEHVALGEYDGILKVGAMLDQAGQDYDATVPYAKFAPDYNENGLNGYPVLSFDGVDDYLEIAEMGLLDSINHITCFMVFRATADSPSGRPIRSAYSNHSLVWGTYISGGSWKSHARNEAGSLKAITPIKPAIKDEWVIKEFTWDGTAIREKWNGSYYGSNNDADMVPGQHVRTRLMADSYESPRNFMAGDLVEVLIWGRTLNPSERLEVGYYLANKYGIDDAVYDDNGYFAIRNLPPANCEEIWSFQLDGRVPADFNRDCIVNIMDLGVIAEQWLMSSGL